MAIQRGLMISPVSFYRTPDSFGLTTPSEYWFMEALPCTLLYWDKLYTPLSLQGHAPDYDSVVNSLVVLGAAETKNLYVDENQCQDYIVSVYNSYRNSLGALRSRQGEIWSVMHLDPEWGDDLAEYAKRFLPPSRNHAVSLEVELKNSLPVPSRDVPYEEILEFKHQRRDNLARLHSEISGISARYANNYDNHTAVALAFSDLNGAIDEMRRVFDEKWTSRTFKRLTSAFVLDGIVPAGLLVALDTPVDKAFLAGLGATIIKSVIPESDASKNGRNPYAYALEAEKL
ncbi:DUF6236 family protein [Paracoccus sp. MKU1]|uniref:DUF6236 family protein n=1 Tax=Paracoccus sp. MKU1 TaxID=1745182 RepID=UPI000AF55F27|nr:DUF6236 family protein [Paracoccus sp. MKU1]